MLIYIIQLNIIKLKYFFKKMTKISQAFIFAAGRGQRMRPFTDTTPKPLAKIAGQAMLGRIIDKVKKVNSINNIIVNGHYLAEQIDGFIQERNDPAITLSLESQKLETGGGLVFAANNGEFDLEQPILLINGDILWQEEGDVNEIEKIFDFYQQNDCDIALGLKKTDQVFGYHGNGDFNLQPDYSLLKDPQEESVHSHVFIGLQVINPKILSRAPSEFFSMSYFYNNFSNLSINIKGVELRSQFFHIGDENSLQNTNKIFLNHER